MTTPKSKPTPEQKAYAKAVKAQAAADADIKYRLEQAESLAAYKAALPKRLMDAQALASKLGVHTSIDLTESGPAVYFSHNISPYIDCTITYESDEWTVDNLESLLDDIKIEQDAREKRRNIAQNAWNGFDEEQKSCLREWITWMR